MNKKLRLNAVITTSAVILCTILINLIISSLAEKIPLEIDMTREKLHEFSTQTEEVMKNLQDDVVAYALYPDDAKGEAIGYVREYLSRYEALSDKFTASYIDPYTDPNFVKKYESGSGSIDVGSIIVTTGEKSSIVSFGDLYTTNRYTNSTYIDMEKKLTSAIMKVTDYGKEVKLYFTEGHSEYECPNLKSILSADELTCESINLMTSPIPDDASALLIADPAVDFTMEELNEIDAFCDGGGHIILSAHPGRIIGENLASYISDWGVTLENDYVVETDSSRAYRSQYGGIYPAPIFKDHAVTKNLIDRKINFIAPMSRSISLSDNNVFYAQHSVLMSTTENSYAKTNLESTSGEFEDGDKKGPLTVASISTRQSKDGTVSRLLTIGSLMAIEEYDIISQNSYANGDFILNALLYLTESSDILDIRAKQVTPEFLTITQGQAKLVTIILYIIPFVIFIIGIILWIRRRYL